jgi:hypothetical protein
MKLVHNKIYYHIQVVKTWNIGEEHFVGLSKNNYCSYFDTNGHNYQDKQSGMLLSPNQVADYVLDYLRTGEKNSDIEGSFSYDIEVILILLNDIVRNYSRYIREYLFEEVRQEFFPNYPSRQKGIWVISNIEHILYWLKTLGANKDSIVFEVELSGKIHEANHASIKLTTNSFNGIRKQAFKYWLGDDNMRTHNQIGNECIFEGFVKVKNIIPIENFII